MPSSLAENLAAVRARIAAAAVAAGRSADSVDLLAVTKSVPARVAEELCRLGQIDLGENRIDALEGKRDHLAAQGLKPRWHFIGHLQRNKARRVVLAADVIHSVDSPRLLDTLARLCAEEKRQIGIYLQVDLTAETTKHGLSLAAASQLARSAQNLPGIQLLGLMAMAPLHETADRDATGVFRSVAQLAQDLSDSFPGTGCRLSMGMSGDFERAIEAGSHCVRVGSLLYCGVKIPGYQGAGAGDESMVGES